MEEILDTPQPQGNYEEKDLKAILRDGFKFDFSKYFDVGFKIFGKAPWEFIGFTAIRAVILLFSMITIIGPLLLIGPLTAGYYIVGEKIDRGEQWEFGDFFKGFQFFAPLLGLHVMIIAIAVAFYAIFFLFIIGMSVPLELADLDHFEEAMASFMVTGGMFFFMGIFFLLSLVVYATTNLIYPFIVNGKVGTIDAIRLSIKLSLKNFWWFMLFGFTISLFEGAGAYVIYIGLLVTIPINSLIKLGAYSTIVGYGDKRKQVAYLK